MADVENDMNIKTKALKVEVCHVPSPSALIMREKVLSFQTVI